MPYEAYIGYLEDQGAAVAAGESIILEVRDLATYERLVVRARVAPPGETLVGGDDLWVLDWVEERQAQPWCIAVCEELDEAAADGMRADIDNDDLKRASESSHQFASGRGRGAAMSPMMGQEEVQKYYQSLRDRKKT